jgi:uncharacterized protein YjbI with pentapeptide repeats
MANQKHISLLQQDVTNWNKWRDNHPDIIPDLSEAVLTECDFDNANLSKANLRGVVLSGIHSSRWDYYDYCNGSHCDANFSAADLRDSKLSACYLSRSNFSNADLRGVQLSRSELSEAKFCNANLSRANLSFACLDGADLSGANLWGADLNGSKLNSANFSRASLEAVDFCGADLSQANFDEADLSRANLSQVKNLTQEQLNTSRLCKTKLPKGIYLDSDRDCVVI